MEEPKTKPKNLTKKQIVEDKNFSIHRTMVKYDKLPEKLVPYFLDVRNQIFSRKPFKFSFKELFMTDFGKLYLRCFGKQDYLSYA